jgi:hypothetical protein
MARHVGGGVLRIQHQGSFARTRGGRTMVAGGHDKVVHPDQAQRQHRHDEQAGRESAGQCHLIIVTGETRQRAPRPLSRL